MLRVEDGALVILAAGRSQRFEGGHKLEQDLAGLPLGLHVTRALRDVPFRARLAVTGAAALDFAAYGFETVTNPDPAEGQAGSLRLGVARAAALGAASVTIVLADMPRVGLGAIGALFAASDGAATVVATRGGRAPGPPALFGAAHFNALAALTGDAGARDLIRGGHHVTADAAMLVDVDTADDLGALRAATA